MYLSSGFCWIQPQPLPCQGYIGHTSLSTGRRLMGGAKMLTKRGVHTHVYRSTTFNEVDYIQFQWLKEICSYISQWRAVKNWHNEYKLYKWS